LRGAERPLQVGEDRRGDGALLEDAGLDQRLERFISLLSTGDRSRGENRCLAFEQIRSRLGRLGKPRPQSPDLLRYGSELGLLERFAGLGTEARLPEKSGVVVETRDGFLGLSDRRNIDRFEPLRPFARRTTAPLSSIALARSGSETGAKSGMSPVAASPATSTAAASSRANDSWATSARSCE